MEAAEVRRSSRLVLGPIDWRVRRGERWVVLGPNGAGKTTLVELASASQRPSAGIVEILGGRLGRVDLRQLRGRLGYAGPAVARRLYSDMTALEVVTSGATASYASWWERPDEAAGLRARGLLAEANLEGREDQRWLTLSEGQRQQVLLSRALVRAPEILVLDEPGTALDLHARETLVARLGSFAHSYPEMAVIMVTHHLEDIPPGFSHALLLNAGRAVFSGPIHEALRPDPLSRCFGLDLEVRLHRGRWSAVAGDTWAP